ncbi:DUF2892 domain-containing protein [bacterium]|nr:DUF2892 domain-containing protein [bacterium]
MKTNMSIIDRVLRGMVALVLGVLILMETFGGVASVVLTIVAVVFIFTAYWGACPIYRLFKVGTLGKGK